MKNPGKTKRQPAKMEKLKVMLLVFSVMIVILAGMGLIAWSMLGETEKDDDAGISGASTVQEMVTAESVVETTESKMLAAGVGENASADLNDAKDYQIPNFVGKNYDTLKGSASYQDWLVFIPKPEYNDQYEKGIIFEQSIPENEFVAKGAQIEVKVSLGSKNVTVPDYYGVSENDYISMLGDIKYTVIYEANVGYAEGLVISTSKEPGETIDVSVGEILTIYVCDNSRSIPNEETKSYY